jgi:hypothetical protein
MNPAIIVLKDEEENKENAIQDYQKYIYTFHCKGNVLVEAVLQNSRVPQITV